MAPAQAWALLQALVQTLRREWPQAWVQVWQLAWGQALQLVWLLESLRELLLVWLLVSEQVLLLAWGQAWLLVLQLVPALLGLESAVRPELPQESLLEWEQALETASAVLVSVLAWAMAYSTTLCPIQTRRWVHY